MPLRPQLPGGLSLSRRVAPVKLPKMTFPMTDDYAEPAVPAGPSAQAPTVGAQAAAQVAAPEASLARLAMFQQQAAVSAPAPVAQQAPQQAAPQEVQAHQIIVYGRSGCQACTAAIQDLIDREMCFTYYDVGRDEQALAHLQSICGGQAMVPVIIQIGYGGA